MIPYFYHLFTNFFTQGSRNYAVFSTAVGPTETTTAPACQNFTIGAHAILAHQEILGGWRVGLTNSSPVLIFFEEERGRAPD